MSNAPVEYPLQGRLALITGCTGGIGQATARAFARAGCSIAVHHSSVKSQLKANALVAELVKLAPGVRAAPFEADLSSYENARKLCDEVVEVLGHPDILFSNHGVTGPKIGPQGDMQEVSAETFEEIWRTNAGTGYVLAQKCVPYMQEKKWGRIVFNSSVAAGTGGFIGPQYASSKSALHGLIHWLSLRYCKEGILTNGVAPALIEGAPRFLLWLPVSAYANIPNQSEPPILGVHSWLAGEDTEMMANPTDAARSLIPIGRLGKPDEIASIVLMLVTNGYMTNKIIVADGGWTNGGGF